MKRAIIIACFLLFALHGNSQAYHFYLQNDYKSQHELFRTLAAEGFDSADNLFKWCCDCIMFYARKFHTSYEMLNLILFVFLQPAIILLLLTMLVVQMIRMKNLKRKLTCSNMNKT